MFLFGVCTDSKGVAYRLHRETVHGGFKVTEICFSRHSLNIHLHTSVVRLKPICVAVCFSLRVRARPQRQIFNKLREKDGIFLPF